MSPVRAIIFDAEGVIVDTEPTWDEVQEAFLARRGKTYERDIVKPHLTGRSLLEGTRVLQLHYGLEGDTTALAEERAGLMRSRLAASVRFLPGFEPFLERVRPRFGVCVATSMPKDLLAITDRVLGISRLFDGRIVTLDDVGGVGKPAPDIFLAAAAIVDAPPSSCVVIEDSPLGIAGAHAAGMACIGMASTYPAEVLRAADLVVGAFDEIDPDRLEALDRRAAP